MTTGSINPYEPPKVEMTVVRPAGPDGAIEAGLAGHYEFEIGEVMSEAWGLTKGFKGSFWGAIVLIGLVQRVATWGILAALGQDHIVWRIGVGMLVGALTAPLSLGLTMMCVRRAAGLPATFSTAFAYFDKAGPAIAVGLLTSLFTGVGLVVLIVPGVYLMVAYTMAQPLIGDRNLGAWQALETSRRAVSHEWFRLAGLLFVVGLLTGLSALAGVIPVIWTLPWAMLVLGVIYRRIFGVAAASDPARIGSVAP